MTYIVVGPVIGLLTPYTCAFGYAMKDADTPIHDVIRLSDERMYADKAATKQRTLEQGGMLHGRTQ